MRLMQVFSRSADNTLEQNMDRVTASQGASFTKHLTGMASVKTLQWKTGRAE